MDFDRFTVVLLLTNPDGPELDGEAAVELQDAHMSHLADLHSMHLCAVLPNVKIMEIDIDDVPWKADLVTDVPVIEHGEMLLPTGPGWGAAINEDVLAAHPWQPTPGRRLGY